MRTLIFLICIAVFLGNEVQAEEPDPSIYGTQLEITIPVDIDSLSDNYKENMTKENWKLWQQWFSITFGQWEQVWSPDGKWIAFTGFTNEFLWIVPANGGVPELVFCDYQYEVETRCFFNRLMYFCFTPDSQEVTFIKIYYDEEKGSTVDITINESGGVHASFKNGIWNIESVNIYTGEHRFLAEGTQPSWSHDGKYLCYIKLDYRNNIDELEADHHGALTVLDTETGEKWFLADGSQRCITSQFTPDDQSVIVSMYNKEKTNQLFRIPVNGGEPEQITFYDSEGDGTGEVFDFDISPDGEWILYYYRNLCLYNLTSGMTYKIFPEPMDPNIDVYFENFSPDGTKICYGLRYYHNYDRIGPFIYIMDIDLEQFTQPIYVEAEEPSSFALLRNYPNPFNPTTTIEYSVPQDSYVTLSIYNGSGQLVSVLKDEYQQAGIHSVTWNATDFPSGLYFYTLKADGFTETRKMSLVR